MRKELKLNQAPPNNRDIEIAILGAIIKESDILHDLQICPDYFYQNDHRTIFSILEEMVKNGKTIDLLSVSETLMRKGLLDQVGGFVYVSKLTDYLFPYSNLKQYVLCLAELSLKRKLLIDSAQLERQIYEGEDLEIIINQLHKSQKEVDQILTRNQKGMNVSEVLKLSLDSLAQRTFADKSNSVIGVPTGLNSLDRLTNGWQKSNLIILAGRPGMGKTAVGLNLFGLEALRAGCDVLFYSLEMSATQLMDRLIIGCSGVDADQYKAGTLNSNEMTAVDIGIHEIEQTKLWIDDSPYCTMPYIRSTGRKRKREGKCDLIIIDYLQLITPDKSAGPVREQQISKISRELKALAKDLDIPIIALSQLSRDVEKRGGTRMPQLSDLRDSGAIEQDADMVIFPYRPAYYEDMINSKDENGQPLKGRVKLIVSKNRNGRTLDVDFYHNESMTLFSESKIE